MSNNFELNFSIPKKTNKQTMIITGQQHSIVMLLLLLWVLEWNVTVQVGHWTFNLIKPTWFTQQHLYLYYHIVQTLDSSSSEQDCALKIHRIKSKAGNKYQSKEKHSKGTTATLNTFYNVQKRGLGYSRQRTHTIKTNPVFETWCFLR